MPRESSDTPQKVRARYMIVIGLPHSAPDPGSDRRVCHAMTGAARGTPDHAVRWVRSAPKGPHMSDLDHTPEQAAREAGLREVSEALLNIEQAKEFNHSLMEFLAA